MAISDKLIQINDIKNDIKEAIIEKGVAVADSDAFSVYPNKIKQIQGGGSATLIEKTITENGEYSATDDNADGYSKVTVDVAGSGDIKLTNASYMFADNARLDQFDALMAAIKDCTTFKNFMYYFTQTPKRAVSLKNLLSKAAATVSFNYAFQNAAAAIITIENDCDWSKIDTLAYAFYNSKDAIVTKDVIIKNLTKCKNIEYAFQNAQIESLDCSEANNNLITNLSGVATITGTSYTPSLISADLSGFKGSTSSGVSLGSTFQGQTKLESVVLPPRITSMSSTFYGCRGLKSVDFTDCSLTACTTFNGAFSSCESITSIKGLDMEAATSTSYCSLFTTASYAPTNLQEITFKKGKTFGKTSTTSEIIFSLAYVRSLSVDAYITLINSLPPIYKGTKPLDLEGADVQPVKVSGTRTIRLYTDLYNSLTDEQKALATDKGYNLTSGTS